MADEQVKHWCNWCQMIPVVVETTEPVDHGVLCFECQRRVGSPEEYERKLETDFEWSKY